MAGSRCCGAQAATPTSTPATLTGPAPQTRVASRHTSPGPGPTPWLLEARLDDPAALLDLDYDALAEGDQAAVVASLPGASPAAPVLLVCTNGRRDVCCAVRGRPVALEASAHAPGRVWEASHTGGHRFAPTGVLLPFGATLARLDPTLCLDVLSSADAASCPSAPSDRSTTAAAAAWSPGRRWRSPTCGACSPRPR